MAPFFRPTASGSSFLMERLPAELNIPVIRNRLGFKIRNKIKSGPSCDGEGVQPTTGGRAEETFAWINACVKSPEGSLMLRPLSPQGLQQRLRRRRRRRKVAMPAAHLRASAVHQPAEER